MEKMCNNADEIRKVEHIRKNIDAMQKLNAKEPSEEELFIYEQVQKTKFLLKQNPGIMVTEADKGKKSFIMNKKEYDDRLDKHLADGTYE